MSKIYQSSISTSHKNLDLLKKELSRFLEHNKTIYCKSLKRKISLSKLPAVLLNRKSSARRRLQRFDVAMDILKKALTFTIRQNQQKQNEYEVLGLSANKKAITIHLREELSPQKNRITYFISCY